ncbi:MAG: hypothetical protein HC915_08815 [Anaerolineae bacterium]|nr:hypothetical protein [Anaerolineae bacterium]
MPNATVAPALPTLLPDSPVIIRAIDTQISVDWQPVRPGTTFTGPQQRFYFFLDYREMRAGTLWEQRLLRDGQLVQAQTQLWGNLPPAGETFFFFGNSSGFAAGDYEIQIYLGETNVLLSRAQFTLLN